MSKETKLWIVIIILSNLFVVSCFIVSRCQRGDNTSVVNIAVHDTVVQTTVDTMVVEQLKPVKVTELRYDTIVINDSISVSIPIALYEYDTVVDSCRIAMKASGYELSIDSLSVQYPFRDIIVTNTVYVPQQKNWFKEHCRFGVGVGVGYGLINRQFDVGVGAGFGVVF